MCRSSRATRVLANRTIIGVFAARRLVLRNPDPTPQALEAPKARALPLRYTPADFVLRKRTCFLSEALKTSLQRSCAPAIARRAAGKSRR